MAVKVTLGEAKPQGEKPFPKLMIGVDGWSKGAIAFFIKEREAVLLYTVPGTAHGFASNLNMRHWADYNEPITLQND